MEKLYKSTQVKKWLHRDGVPGNILSKLSVFIDNNRAVLKVITLIALCILSGYILSLPWFDENANFLKLLSNKNEVLAWLGVLAAVMIPIWIEVVHLCNENNLVGSVLHRVLRTKESLYTTVTCLVLVAISPRASYLYMPAITFMITSFNLAHEYFIVACSPSRSNNKVVKLSPELQKMFYVPYQ